MKLSEAIALMQKKLVRNGDMDVWFDCPHCGRSFAPNRVVAVAVHITEGKEQAEGEGGGR